MEDPVSEQDLQDFDGWAKGLDPGTVRDVTVGRVMALVGEVRRLREVLESNPIHVLEDMSYLHGNNNEYQLRLIALGKAVEAMQLGEWLGVVKDEEKDQQYWVLYEDLYLQDTITDRYWHTPLEALNEAEEEE